MTATHGYVLARWAGGEARSTYRQIAGPSYRTSCNGHERRFCPSTWAVQGQLLQLSSERRMCIKHRWCCPEEVWHTRQRGAGRAEVARAGRRDSPVRPAGGARIIACLWHRRQRATAWEVASHDNAVRLAPLVSSRHGTETQAITGELAESAAPVRRAASAGRAATTTKSEIIWDWRRQTQRAIAPDATANHLV